MNLNPSIEPFSLANWRLGATNMDCCPGFCSHYSVTHSEDATVYQEVTVQVAWISARFLHSGTPYQFQKSTTFLSPRWWIISRLGKYAFTWWRGPQPMSSSAGYNQITKLASNGQQQKPPITEYSLRTKEIMRVTQTIEMAWASQGTRFSPISFQMEN